MTQEHIIGVAIRFSAQNPQRTSDGEIIGRVLHLPAPNRHHNLFREYHEVIDRLRNDRLVETQGFITSMRRFVDREEALKIAEAANQIVEKRPQFDELYSEDLW